MFEVLIIETAVIVIYMTVWFIVAQMLKRNDIADVVWGTGFIVTAISVTMYADAVSSRGLLAALLVTIWGTRLAGHIYMRNRGKPEDTRYRKWREEWGNHAVIRVYLQIFLLQGLLMIIISLPVTVIILDAQGGYGIFDVIGVCIWITGFFFEAVGDYQLMKYKKDLANKGKVMTKGLWKYTRHPNYFGEVRASGNIRGIPIISVK
jgi:steroid 5-alpha reductase family enzyme